MVVMVMVMVVMIVVPHPVAGSKPSTALNPQSLPRLPPALLLGFINRVFGVGTVVRVFVRAMC